MSQEQPTAAPITLAEAQPADQSGAPIKDVAGPGDAPVTTTQPKQQGTVEQVHAQLTESKNAKLMGEFCAPGYQTPFFGCLEDPTGCLLSCCCPACVAAQVKADLDNRPCTIWDCFFFPWPFQNRQQFRSKYGYEHAGFNDCIAQCCCTCCMVNQEVREFALRNGTQPRYMTAPSI